MLEHQRLTPQKLLWSLNMERLANKCNLVKYILNYHLLNYNNHSETLFTNV